MISSVNNGNRWLVSGFRDFVERGFHFHFMFLYSCMMHQNASTRRLSILLPSGYIRSIRFDRQCMCYTYRIRMTSKVANFRITNIDIGYHAPHQNLYTEMVDYRIAYAIFYTQGWLAGSGSVGSSGHSVGCCISPLRSALQIPLLHWIITS